MLFFVLLSLCCVWCLVFGVWCYFVLCSCLLSLVSCLLSLVSCLLSLVSCLLSLVSCLLSLEDAACCVSTGLPNLQRYYCYDGQENSNDPESYNYLAFV
ncbi:hypothetical protein FHG64_06675 [Antarcticibacterium flavum]|uniref:Uncharacterized protein n=1 Tax=Antarcticibacterium flavum TaxID=2058175 RepID=A0A5B7X1Y7_9FLAO|nr:hypothetical protein FHG64_06675 [Antarcticibacterium flavum]